MHFLETQWLSLCQDYTYIYMNAIAQQDLKVHMVKLCQLSETVSCGIRVVQVVESIITSLRNR